MVSLIASTQEPSGGGLTEFSCTSVPMPGCVHVLPRGELDIATVPHLDRSLRKASDAEHEIVLDLRRLEFIDCSAAQFLISASRRISRSGGRLRVIGGSGEVAWLMQLVGLDTELEMIEPPGLDEPSGPRPRALLV